jgi:ankyrin repeat protein
VNVNITGDFGDTALIFAARAGHKNIIALLLNHVTIDANIKGQNGLTALHCCSGEK